MEGIFRWIRLKLDPKSAKAMRDQAQEALDKGTDPKKPKQNLKKVEDGFEKLKQQARKLIPILAAALSARAILRATNENAAALAQLDNVIRATGNAAGFTTEQMANLSVEMARASTTSSAAVQAGLARLLAYTNIQGEAFERAAKATLNMSTALGIDMASAAETLGRALDDPINGLGALSRQGFKFGAEQRALIASFMAVNDVAGAQGVVLESIEATYEGAALAARETLGGALSALKNEWADQISLTGEAQGVLAAFINTLTEALPTGGKIARETLSAIGLAIMQFAEILDNVLLANAWGLDRLTAGRYGILNKIQERVDRAQEQRDLMRARILRRELELRGLIRDMTPPPKAAGHTVDNTERIQAAILATDSFIKSLEKERDALKFSRWELIERSDEYRNATRTQKTYILTLFQEAEMMREQERIRTENEKARLAAEAKLEREQQARADTIERATTALEREYETLGLNERQIFQTSEAYRMANEAQREYMLSVFDATEARRLQMEVEKAAEAQAAAMAQAMVARQRVFAEDMADAFQPFFQGMILGFAGMSASVDGFRETITGLGATIVESLIEGRAEEQMASGMAALASGTWPPNPAALSAAGMHFAAAAAFKAIPGAIRGAGRSRGSDTPRTAAMGAANRTTAQADRNPPEINIYIDPLNPTNPAWQTNIAQTLRGVTQRYGSANVNVRPRT